MKRKNKKLEEKLKSKMVIGNIGFLPLRVGKKPTNIRSQMKKLRTVFRVNTRLLQSLSKNNKLMNKKMETKLIALLMKKKMIVLN